MSLPVKFFNSGTKYGLGKNLTSKRVSTSSGIPFEKPNETTLKIN